MMIMLKSVEFLKTKSSVTNNQLQHGQKLCTRVIFFSFFQIPFMNLIPIKVQKLQEPYLCVGALELKQHFCRIEKYLEFYNVLFCDLSFSLQVAVIWCIKFNINCLQKDCFMCEDCKCMFSLNSTFFLLIVWNAKRARYVSAKPFI